jgi:RNA polymerase sigma factor (sigma-70 family)
MPEARNWVPGTIERPNLATSMKQEPENGKDVSPGTPAGTGSSSSLAGHRALLDRLFAESGAHLWNLPRERFELAIERSAQKQFVGCDPNPQKLEDYLGALHVKDLALAWACAEGRAEAWDVFVATYRVYLRTAAGAILRCPANSAAACDLADSLFADLYGLGSAKSDKRAEVSLFRYFHGRSSLKTWLRAILAQRHIDAIRAARRFEELEQDDDASQRSSHLSKPAANTESPADPHRARYVALLTQAFELALARLEPRDLERLRLYYAEQQTLAEIARAFHEHESSTSRNLDRIRRELRSQVEATLQSGQPAVNGAATEPGLNEAQIALCFQYAVEDAPIDVEKLLPRSGQPPKSPRPSS